MLHSECFTLICLHNKISHVSKCFFYKRAMNCNHFLEEAETSHNMTSTSVHLSTFRTFSHLLEIVLSEFVCDAEQLAAGVCISEGPDAQAVGGIQLPLEELAAGLLDLSQLQQASRREQSLNVPLLYCHLESSTEVSTSQLL